MSVYIKSMEMPESCFECPIANPDDGYITYYCPLAEYEDVTENYLSHKRSENCPLIPVPDHGRLIDADAFSAKIIEIVERQKYDDFYAAQSLSVGAILREVVNELKGTALDGYANAPTIIPAEEVRDGTIS